MARRSTARKETVPPTISPQQAIPLIRRQIERADEIMNIHHNDPRVDAWENTTQNILTGVYGLPNGELHHNTYEFRTMSSGVSLHVNMSNAEIQDDHELKQQKRKALLEAIVEQLQTSHHQPQPRRQTNIVSIPKSSESAANSTAMAITSKLH